MLLYQYLSKVSGQCLYFSFSIHKQCILSHFLHNSTAMIPKKPYTQGSWDSNPGILVPEADEMAPRRQGYFSNT
jgi:hypothetical protein